MGNTKYVGDGWDHQKQVILNVRQHPITTSDRTSMGIGLNSTHKGIHVWDTDENVAYYWSGSAWVSASGVPQYTDEKAQDAVGAILIDTDTIDFNYHDAANQITAGVRRQMSITSDTSGIKLDGDVTTPGNSKYYGTDAEGDRGWHDLPAGTDPGYEFGYSLILGEQVDKVTLKGDVTTPGNSKYYGTNGSGTKGWFGLPNSGITYSFPASVKLNDATVSVANSLSLLNDQVNPGNLKYYGTNISGTKGWYVFPATFGTAGYTFRYSINETSPGSGIVNLVNDAATPGNSKYYGTNVSGLRGWFDIPDTSSSLNFNNGLFQSGSDIGLGGTLLEDRTVDQSFYKMRWEGTLDYASMPTNYMQWKPYFGRFDLWSDAGLYDGNPTSDFLQVLMSPIEVYMFNRAYASTQQNVTFHMNQTYIENSISTPAHGGGFIGLEDDNISLDAFLTLRQLSDGRPFGVNATSLDNSIRFGKGTATNDFAFQQLIMYSDRILLGTRLELKKGSNIAAANDLTLGAGGNSFTITGNTQVNAILTTNWQAGSIVHLLFTGTPTVKHNTAGGAGTATLLLQGAVDLNAAANTVLGLWYDGTNWHEISRKVTAGVSGGNIYNTDGSLTGNRTLTLNGHELVFQGTGSNSITFDNEFTDITFDDGTSFMNSEYSAGEYYLNIGTGVGVLNHKSNITVIPESIQTYVSSNGYYPRWFVRSDGTSGESVVESIVDNTGVIGVVGPATKGTKIYQNADEVYIKATRTPSILASYKGIELDLDGNVYLEVVAHDDSETKLLTWDSVNNIVKYRNVSSISGSSYTFSNGLTETGGAVKLGGALANDTDISDNGTYKLTFSKNVANTNALEETLRLTRNTTGTAANGIGASFDWYIETNAGSAAQFAGKIGMQWSNATDGVRSSQFDVYLIDGATDAGTPKASLLSNGTWKVAAGIQTADPGGGSTAKVWKFGDVVTLGGLTFNDGQYLEVAVDGNVYQVAIVALP